jgi:hypothetical protein
MPDRITRSKMTITVIWSQMKPPISLKTNSIRGPHGGGILQAKEQADASKLVALKSLGHWVGDIH